VREERRCMSAAGNSAQRRSINTIEYVACLPGKHMLAGGVSKSCWREGLKRVAA